MITTDPYGISHAERPWISPGARRVEHINTYDTPEQIARCQNCPHVECVDCIGAHWRNCSSKTAKRWKNCRQSLFVLYGG